MGGGVEIRDYPGLFNGSTNQRSTKSTNQRSTQSTNQLFPNQQFPYSAFFPHSPQNLAPGSNLAPHSVQ